MEKRSIWRAVERLTSIPHLNYGHYPTPIEELPRLREALSIKSGGGGGAPRLFIKRDDYTGPGFGGNKMRKLEYMLARAVADGAEVAITSGGERSNHARVTAAMCARLGLRSILVLNAASPAGDSSMPKPASLRLDEMLGAEIHRVGSRQERAEVAGASAGQRVATGFGNSGVGIVDGPGPNNTDLALPKRTPLGWPTEATNLEFRAEFFNALNTPQFANPCAEFTTAATFSRITSTRVNPRIAQFALKFNF